MSTYVEPWQAIQDHLAAELAIAMLPGNALDFLKGIDPVAPPESAVDPILGWQWRGSGDQPYGQNRQVQTGTFEFNLVVARSFDPTATDAVRLTKELAEKYWNDRAGRGLGAFLRSDPTLGGTVIYATVSNHQVSVGRNVLDENTTSAVIVATLTYVTDFPIFN